MMEQSGGQDAVCGRGMSHEGAAAAATKKAKAEERAQRSLYLFDLDNSFRKWYFT